MENLSNNLLDLPEELLLIIFKQLNNVELLYSLMGINKQVDRILNDSSFTNNLSLINLSNNYICSLSSQILDRFSLEILPKIYQKIECLTVESFSMERILTAYDYPNLHKLCLISIEEETIIHLFNGKIF